MTLCGSRYGHSKFSKMASGRHLKCDITRNSAIRSTDHENPTLEPNMKCIGSLVAEILPFAYHGGIWDPHFGGRRSLRGSVMVPFERAKKALHCDHCAICNHSAANCDRMSPTLKSTGGGLLWAQISGCSPSNRSMMFGSAEGECPTLTNREIIFEECQPM